MVSLPGVGISNFGLPSRCLQRLHRRSLFETIHELRLWASSGQFWDMPNVRFESLAVVQINFSSTAALWWKAA